MKAVQPRDLTEEEKKRPYAYLFYREPQDISELAKKTLAAGPMDPKYVMTADNIREKTVHVAPEEESGYCLLPDGGAYVTGTHHMPGITIEMYRHWLYWWNNEKPEEADTRYKIWCPPHHHDSGFMFSTENIGDDVLALIVTEPMADMPEKIGLDEELMKEAGLLMVDGANAQQIFMREDVMNAPTPSVVMHFIYDAPDGIIMRSHFWIGFYALGGRITKVCGPGPIVEESFLRGLLEHNSLEMNYLKQLMPILWKDFR